VIIFLVSAAHGYTLKNVIESSAEVRVQATTYPHLLRARRLPRATYVFTDVDRLSPPALRAAADAYRRMRDAGLRVLNDPARMPSRLGLLRSLHAAGINRFNAYRAEEYATPQRWPVFLRCEGAHEAPRSDLLPDKASLTRAIDDAVAAGVPLTSLLVIEYAAEPIRPGLFRKLACFQMGAASFAHHCVHDTQWAVKYGQKGIAGEELYADELRILRDNPFGEKLSAVFRGAGIEYGRADFGLVGGEPQIYEINSNPDVKFPGDEKHPSPSRRESNRVFRANYLAALKTIDTAADPADRLRAGDAV
jgi:hypothetical protein